jgi:hypothetical protein
LTETITSLSAASFPRLNPHSVAYDERTRVTVFSETAVDVDDFVGVERDAGVCSRSEPADGPGVSAGCEDVGG